jgi:hypothetical protein
MEEVNRHLYGNANGDYLIVEGPISEPMIPPTIVGLQLIGQTFDVFTCLNYHMRQRDLAELAGLKQQAVSRYIIGNEPRVKPDAWRALVKAWFREHHALGDHAHTLELYRENVQAPFRRRKGQWRSKTPGYWWHIYFPKAPLLGQPHLASLGKWPYGTSITQIIDSPDFSDEFRQWIRDATWHSYVVDSELTQDWKKAEKIAAEHFDYQAS